MDKLKYRNPAAAVALIDQARLTIELVLVLYASSAIPKEGRIAGFHGALLAVLVTLLFTIGLVAAMKLYRSTNLEVRGPLSAAKLARFWRNCAIVVIIVEILLAVLVEVNVFEVINIIFQAVGLFIIIKYIKELDSYGQTLPTITISCHPIESAGEESALFTNKGEGDQEETPEPQEEQNVTQNHVDRYLPMEIEMKEMSSTSNNNLSKTSQIHEI